MEHLDLRFSPGACATPSSWLGTCIAGVYEQCVMIW